MPHINRLKSRPGYLLLETLIGLMIIAILAGVWMDFLRSHNQSSIANELSDFFKAKQYLLRTLNGEALPEVLDFGSVHFTIAKQPYNESLKKVIVNASRENMPECSLVGFMR